MDDPMYSRYAVYFCPRPDSDLARFGARWLGWDVEKGQTINHPDIEGFPESIEDLTETPRKYGFHGTIKAPFRLATGQDEAALSQALDSFATARKRFEIGILEASRIGGFVALTQKSPNPALGRIAADCVIGLDPFRAPMRQAELENRRKSGLTGRQDELLLQWGYPYVLDEFRFHMTLTGSLSEADGAEVRSALGRHLAPILERPVVMEDLCLCGQGDDGYFRVIERFSLSR